jgi:chromosome segregation ATPase
MPPDDAALRALGHLRLRLLPGLASLSARIARLREERDGLSRQALGLAAQLRELHQQVERDRERLIARGPTSGSALAGVDGVRRRLEKRTVELSRLRERALDRIRVVDLELERCFSGLLRERRRLDVVGERIGQRRRFLGARAADARLEELVEDCAGVPRR